MSQLLILLPIAANCNPVQDTDLLPFPKSEYGQSDQITVHKKTI